GQANHFFRYAPAEIAYPRDWYQNETRRLYWVLEARLEYRDYLVGRGQGKSGVAGMSTFTWVRCATWAGFDLEKF
ncbi:hypothetical protein BU24DRAFT_319256, partial [Aaosphaeria arxii CBS 175.79]